MLQIRLHDLLEPHYLSSFTKSFLSRHIPKYLYHVWHRWMQDSGGENVQAVINLFLYIYIFIFLYLSSFLSLHIPKYLYHVWHLWVQDSGGKNLQAVINLLQM